MTLHTDSGELKYALEVRIPLQMLSECMRLLPRPYFERYFYFFVLCLVVIFVVTVAVAASFESRLLLNDHFENKHFIVTSIYKPKKRTSDSSPQSTLNKSDKRKSKPIKTTTDSATDSSADAKNQRTKFSGCSEPNVLTHRSCKRKSPPVDTYANISESVNTSPRMAPKQPRATVENPPVHKVVSKHQSAPSKPSTVPKNQNQSPKIYLKSISIEGPGIESIKIVEKKSKVGVNKDLVDLEPKSSSTPKPVEPNNSVEISLRKTTVSRKLKASAKPSDEVKLSNALKAESKKVAVASEAKSGVKGEKVSKLASKKESINIVDTGSNEEPYISVKAGESVSESMLSELNDTIEIGDRSMNSSEEISDELSDESGIKIDYDYIVMKSEELRQQQNDVDSHAHKKSYYSIFPSFNMSKEYSFSDSCLNSTQEESMFAPKSHNKVQKQIGPIQRPMKEKPTEVGNRNIFNDFMSANQNQSQIFNYQDFNGFGNANDFQFCYNPFQSLNNPFSINENPWSNSASPELPNGSETNANSALFEAFQASNFNAPANDWAVLDKDEHDNLVFNDQMLLWNPTMWENFVNLINSNARSIEQSPATTTTESGFDEAAQFNLNMNVNVNLNLNLSLSTEEQANLISQYLSMNQNHGSLYNQLQQAYNQVQESMFNPAFGAFEQSNIQEFNFGEPNQNQNSSQGNDN